MSFWKRLWSSPDVVADTVEKATDAVIRTGDAVWYTEEEKAQDRKYFLEWLVQFHAASSGSRLARRMIAISTSFVFLLQVIAVTIMLITGVGNPTSLVQFMIDVMVWPVSTIFVFYYGNTIVQSMKKNKE